MCNYKPQQNHNHVEEYLKQGCLKVMEAIPDKRMMQVGLVWAER